MQITSTALFSKRMMASGSESEDRESAERELSCDNVNKVRDCKGMDKLLSVRYIVLLTKTCTLIPHWEIKIHFCI